MPEIFLDASIERNSPQGTPIPTNDIWIAATALENGGRVVAYGSHFEVIPGLIVEAP